MVKLFLSLLVHNLTPKNVKLETLNLSPIYVEEHTVLWDASVQSQRGGGEVFGSDRLESIGQEVQLQREAGDAEVTEFGDQSGGEDCMCRLYKEDE